MAMPDLEIYKFRKWWESAVTSWLLKNGVNDPARQREDKIDLEGKKVTLKTPRVEVKWLGGGFSRELYFVVPQTNLRWLNIYSGTGYLKIVTRRGDPKQDHEAIEALCRYLMQQVSQITAFMKYHRIEKMLEQQQSVTFDNETLHDVSALSFQTDIRIRQEFFPTS